MNRHATLQQLSACIDDELIDRELHAVARHLEGCSSCRDRMAGLRAASARLGRLAREVPPAPLARRVRRAAERGPAGHRLLERLEDGVRGRLSQPVFGPAFAVVLALGVIIYLFSQGLAREDRTRTRVIIQPAPAEEQVTPPPESRAAAGLAVGDRRFERVGGLWIELGLGAEEVVETRDLEPGDTVSGLTAGQLESLRPLGRVRLRADGRVIEITFLPDGQASR